MVKINTINTDSVLDKETLRQQLRLRRTSLTLTQQQQAQKQLAAIVCTLPAFNNSHHIALYIANDGEINPADIALEARRQNKVCYLPVIDKPNKMDMFFLPFELNTTMRNNQYGIPEPILTDSPVCQAKDLDLILVPLTGFDLQGRRMGMGGGYYDRALAFKRSSDTKKTVVIGLAHECQKVKTLPVSDWDISLDGIASDLKFYNCCTP
ncbi:MAG: 5-formyltetrahydrofolate cyclo-ligase [Endozoicomonas sp. (ex Botrylloides leachii)]|nr:5-formyltetrahydrofolate cyclo-ligase [Endozoicomonas sp. (ex Botrylloides leachii)]